MKEIKDIKKELENLSEIDKIKRANEIFEEILEETRLKKNEKI